MFVYASPIQVKICSAAVECYLSLSLSLSLSLPPLSWSGNPLFHPVGMCTNFLVADCVSKLKLKAA